MLKFVAEGIDGALLRWCGFFFRRPLVGLALIALVFALALSQASRITRDGSIEGFFHADSPEIAQYDAFKRQFGQDGEIVVAVESENLFSAHALQRLAALHQALLQGAPYVEDITSLFNVRHVVGGSELFVVNEHLAHFLRRGDFSQAALDAFRDETLTHPVFRDLVVSGDGRMTLLTLRPYRFAPQSEPPAAGAAGDVFAAVDAILPDKASVSSSSAFLGPAQTGEMAAAVRGIAESFEQPDFRISIAGAPVASSEVVRILSSDMPRFTLICLLAMLAVVFAFTRRFAAALALFGVTALSIVSTVGLMGAAGVAIKPPTQVLPSIAIVASACAVLHFVQFFIQARGRAAAPGEDPVEARRRAMSETIGNTGAPILFTSLTTAAGLASFAGSSLAPVSDLGIFGAAAVMLVFVATMTLCPILFRLFPFRPAAPGRLQDRVLLAARGVAAFSARNRRAVLQTSFVIVLFAALGLTGLRFHHNSLEWLPADNEVRVDTQTIDAKMRGSINLEAVIRTQGPRGVQNGALLAAIDAVVADIPAIARETGFESGKVFGVNDLLREVNHALFPAQAGSYRLPEGEMVARQFLLFENSSSNDLPDFVDSRYVQTRVTIRVPWLEAGVYAAFIDRLQKRFDEALAPHGVVSVSLTGNMALLAQTSVNVIQSMATSYVLSLVFIGGLMILAMGGLRLGLLAMLPNLAPIVIGLGVMGFVGAPLDTFTMLIGCIALGLIVDDTIHFFHQVRRARERRLDVDGMVDLAVRNTFMPILGTTLAVVAGFSAYAMSTMVNVVAFGLVIALVSAMALIADMILSPALAASLREYREPDPAPAPAALAEAVA